MNSKATVSVMGVCVTVALMLVSGCGGVNLDGPPEDNLENQAPVADAGNDQSVPAASTAQLDGTGSFDPDDDALSFSWVQIAGSPVSLNDGDSPAPSFTAPDDETTMIFELTVDDGQTTDSDVVTIECIAEVDNNQAPFADAGSDQFAEGGSTVQLDGAASFDPDGDTLTFNWAQTSGTAVSLIGGQTATPTFIAPNEDGSMSFELTVSDGNGGSDTDSMIVDTEAKATVLFVTGFLSNNVVSFVDPSTLNGNIAPDTNLQGAQTLLDQPSDVVVTASNDMIVTNFNTPSVTSYVDAETTNGNLTPDGNVFGAATLLNGPTSLALNPGLDLLFVSDINQDVIFVYAGASTSSFNGNLAPVRTIATTTSGEINNPVGINFGANDELYIANNGGGDILVFANASNLNGDVTPSRIIQSPVFSQVFDVYIDGDDTMFVVEFDLAGDQDFVHIFNAASTLNGLTLPDFSLQVVGAGVLSAIAVDAAGTGYLVDATENAIFSYDGIATLNGALAPDRTIQGTNTQLNQPIRLFLAE